MAPPTNRSAARRAGRSRRSWTELVFGRDPRTEAPAAVPASPPVPAPAPAPPRRTRRRDPLRSAVLDQLIDESALGPRGRAIGDGGQGVVFELPRLPGSLLKVHRLRAEPSPAGLLALVQVRAHLHLADRSWLDEHCAMPLRAVRAVPDVGAGLADLGIVMRRAPDAFFSSAGAAAGSPRTIAHLYTGTGDHERTATPRERIAVSRDVARVLEILESGSMTLPDLQADNVLCCLAPVVRTFVIDADSASLRRAPRALKFVEAPLWADPYLHDRRGFDVEVQVCRYKLALLFLRVWFGTTAVLDEGEDIRRFLPMATYDAKLPRGLWLGTAHGVPFSTSPPVTPRVYGYLAGGLGPLGGRPSPGQWRAALAELDGAWLAA